MFRYRGTHNRREEQVERNEKRESPKMIWVFLPPHPLRRKRAEKKERNIRIEEREERNIKQKRLNSERRKMKISERESEERG